MGKRKASKTDLVKAGPALTVDGRSVGALLRAVKNKKLSRDQHELLQALIVQMERVEGRSEGLGTTVRYNLQVIDTQIRDVLERADGDAFDEEAIAKMPPTMQARIVERLENVVQRLESESAREKIKSYSTSTFKCLDDYEVCRRAVKSGGYWCTIALLVCLAGNLGEAFVTGKKK
jgi:hypothetical protein